MPTHVCGGAAGGELGGVVKLLGDSMAESSRCPCVSQASVGSGPRETERGEKMCVSGAQSRGAGSQRAIIHVGARGRRERGNKKARARFVRSKVRGPARSSLL